MNRYRISREQITKAKKFLKDGKTRAVPAWATKHKDLLTVKGGKLYYDGKLVVPREEVNDYLRKRLYDKNTDLQQSRDSAHYQVMKDTVGVTRRTIMEFLRSQKTLGETRPQVTKPVSKGGKKLKKDSKNIFETDLIFIMKKDLEKQNPRFSRKMDKRLTYALCTTDKLTGLTKLDEVTSKSPALVTKKVEEHIKWLAKKLKLKLSDCALHSDDGDEFIHEQLGKLVPETKVVNTGVSVEKKNQQVQQYFYRVLKNRQAITVKNALSKTENLVNNCYSRIQKKTPLEACEEKQEDRLKNYNKTRTQYVNSDKRELQVGDYVRILELGPKKGIDYKSYKNKTWTKKVYKITKRTLNAKPVKYRVNRVYYTVDKLLKSAPRDEKSNKIITERDEQQAAEDMVEMEKQNKELKANRKKLMANYKKAGDKKKVAQLKQLQENREKQEEVDKLIEEEEKKEEKAAGRKLKGSVMKEFVNAPVVDEDYKPKARKKKPKAKKKTLPKAQRLRLIRKHMRLNKAYKRLMKKKDLTDEEKRQKADIRKEGLALVEEFKQTPFKHKMDLDAFNEK